MGLDDFTGDSTLSEDYQELREELAQNSPPGDDSKWHRYEPGTPDWLSFIVGDIEDSDSVPQSLKYSNKELDSEEVLVVNIDNLKSTTLVSTGFVDLEEYI